MEDWKVITTVMVVGLLSAVVTGVIVFSYINALRTPAYPATYSYAPYQPPIVNSTPPPSLGNGSNYQNQYTYPTYPNTPTYPSQPYPQQPGYPPSYYPPYNGYPYGGYGYGYGMHGFGPWGGMG